MFPLTPPPIPPWPGAKPPWQSTQHGSGSAEQPPRQQQPQAPGQAQAQAQVQSPAPPPVHIQPLVPRDTPPQGMITPRPVVLHGLLPPQPMHQVVPFWYGPPYVNQLMQHPQPAPPPQQAPPVQAQPPQAPAQAQGRPAEPQGPPPRVKMERTDTEKSTVTSYHPVAPVAGVYPPLGLRQRLI